MHVKYVLPVRTGNSTSGSFYFSQRPDENFMMMFIQFLYGWSPGLHFIQFLVDNRIGQRPQLVLLYSLIIHSSMNLFFTTLQEVYTLFYQVFEA